MSTLPIFRAGKHIASSGQSIEFSEADLTACVKAYDPALHEAPLVVGHPTSDAPAYGWVNRLAFSEGELSAEPDEVDVLTDRVEAKGTGAMTRLLEPVRRLVQCSESLEEIRDGILELYPEMDSASLAETLTDAMAVAFRRGKASVR